MLFLQKLAYVTTIAPRLRKLRRYLPKAEVVPAGSRYVCNPPKMFTDIDFLIWAEDDAREEVHLVLQGLGYRETIHVLRYANLMNKFRCYRKGKVNLIVAEKYEYFLSFDVGTLICKRFNVRDKHMRVIIHEILRSGDLTVFYAAELVLIHEPFKRLLEPLCGPHRIALMKAFRIRELEENDANS